MTEPNWTFLNEAYEQVNRARIPLSFGNFSIKTHARIAQTTTKIDSQEAIVRECYKRRKRL